MSKKKKEFDAESFILELAERLKTETAAPNIKKYKPHHKQFLFHESTKKKKLYIGGNRSGKTVGGVTEGIWRATCTHPYRPDLNALGPTRGRVIASDFINGVEKIIFPQYQQWLYPSALKGGSWETAYNKYLRLLTFANGSTIEFMSYDQDLVKFAGTSRHWVHMDEEPPESIYQENRARLIDTDGDFWITMTPVEGMTWVYDTLYENPDDDTLVLEINTLENPYLEESAVRSFIESIDEEEMQARVQGKFVQTGGRIYPGFDPVVGGKHVLAEEITNPGEDFKHWMWILSLDHGLNNPTAVLWTAVDQNGFAITFDEIYVTGEVVSQIARRIQEKIRDHGRAPDLFVADPSIAARNGITGTSVRDEYIKHGIAFKMGTNDIKGGINKVRSFWRIHKYVGRPSHPLMEGEGFPRLRIAPNCKKTIWEAKRYRWKTYENKKKRDANNNREEPHQKDDHAMDSLRYALMTQPYLIAERETESKTSKLNEALEGFFEDGTPLFSESLTRSVADPFDRIDQNNPWYGENRSEGSWEYDEHMGGFF